MMSKFLAHGSDIFDTYELLEMLLYNVIPYKDTNPIAKRLLAAFGSLEGVFSASREELMQIDGIGERAAEYIKTVDKIPYLLSCDTVRRESDFNDYARAGQFFAEYFKGSLEYRVAVIFLDNSMFPVEIKELYNVDFNSAAIKPVNFISEALSCRASVAIIAHNHPFGPNFPSEHDITNNDMIAKALDEVDVLLLEHYVVSGECYVGFMARFNKTLAQAPSVRDFLDSKKRALLFGKLKKSEGGEDE